MRKVILLSIPLLVLIGTVLAVDIGDAALHPSWQPELSKYIRSKKAFITIKAVDQASRPVNFNQDMSSAAFSDDVFYTQGYGGGQSGYRNLPFPPEEVWCVLLKKTRRAADDSIVESTYSVVFVARHLDMWHADWVVHEGEQEPFSPAFLEKLSKIGCDLGREMKPG